MIDTWDPVGASRKIPAKEQGNRGFFPSKKIDDAIIAYESELERDLLIESNHAPDVKRIQHQPVTIHYTTKAGKQGRYTPDVFLEFVDGTRLLIEVKYAEEVQKKKTTYKERWDNAKEWANERNMHFLILTEHEIRTPRWYNIWFTIGSSKCISCEKYISQLNSLISPNGERYFVLCTLLSETNGFSLNKAAQIIGYAIYHGLVFVDSFSTQQISNETIIRKKLRDGSLMFKSLLDEFGINNYNLLSDSSYQYQDNKPFEKTESDHKFSFMIPEEYQEIVELRRKIVDLWLKQPKQLRSVEWRSDFCKKWSISERTIYYWVKSYQAEGIAGLIPNHKLKGKSIEEDQTIFEHFEKARLQYFKPLISLKKAYRTLVESCNNHQIPIPNESSFRTYIYRNSSKIDFAQKRGKKYVKSNFSPSLASFQGACTPMHILQLDNTSFDVFLVDSEERQRLSPPYLTVAIDCYTRMITGFNLSFFPSSARSVLDALVQSILPKQDYSKTFDTQTDWEIQGFPVLILVDNGLDYRSKLLMDFCMKYDIIIEFAPIRTPRYKASVEQWFNILRNAISNEDVSGYRPLLKQRIENPELKPEADAILTLQEIEIWLHKWVLDEYHFTNPYEDRVPAPYLRWQQYQEGNTAIILPLAREPPETPQEIDCLYLSKLHQIDRILGYQGIIWEHLIYNNQELAKVYRRIGKQTVKVFLNQRDIRNVWVLPSNESVPIYVDLASGWAQAIANVYADAPIHASAWIKDISQIKTTLQTRITPFIYHKEISRVQRNQLLADAKQITKTTRKESEKIKETKRKAKFDQMKIDRKDEKKSKNYSPKKQYKPEDIDWDNLPVLWTDDFYSGE